MLVSAWIAYTPIVDVPGMEKSVGTLNGGARDAVAVADTVVVPTGRVAAADLDTVEALADADAHRVGRDDRVGVARPERVQVGRLLLDAVPVRSGVRVGDGRADGETVRLPVGEDESVRGAVLVFDGRPDDEPDTVADVERRAEAEPASDTVSSAVCDRVATCEFVVVTVVTIVRVVVGAAEAVPAAESDVVRTLERDAELQGDGDGERTEERVADGVSVALAERVDDFEGTSDCDTRAEVDGRVEAVGETVPLRSAVLVGVLLAAPEREGEPDVLVVRVMIMDGVAPIVPDTVRERTLDGVAARVGVAHEVADAEAAALADGVRVSADALNDGEPDADEEGALDAVTADNV